MRLLYGVEDEGQDHGLFTLPHNFIIHNAHGPWLPLIYSHVIISSINNYLGRQYRCCRASLCDDASHSTHHNEPATCTSEAVLCVPVTHSQLAALSPFSADVGQSRPKLGKTESASRERQESKFGVAEWPGGGPRLYCWCGGFFSSARVSNQSEHLVHSRLRQS